MNYFTAMVAFFLIPLVMVICGMSYTKRAPKRISKLAGFRTKMSMKNRDTWEFAHKHLGDLWFKLGTPLLGLACFLVVMPLLIWRYYDWHTQGAMSVYTMRRLPNRWELHIRCLTVPVVTAALAVVLALLLLTLYYAFYCWLVPAECIVPGQIPFLISEMTGGIF